MEGNRKDLSKTKGIAEKAGKWLFNKRGVIPLAIFAYPLLFTRGIKSGHRIDILAGFLLLLSGEAIRLWSVGYIGSLSRSRHGTLKALVSGGPYRMARNPIYVGNGLQWVGIGFLGGVRWYVPVIGVFFILVYALIVRWEEMLLEDKFGEDYRKYAAEVPRWFPRRWAGGRSGEKWDGAEAFRSEKNTFRSLTVIVGVLMVKYLIFHL